MALAAPDVEMLANAVWCFIDAEVGEFRVAAPAGEEE